MWTLSTSQTAGPALPIGSKLPSEGCVYIVSQSTVSAIGIVHTLHGSKAHTALGRITVGSWGLKLAAINEPLSVVPRYAPASADTTIAASILDPRTAAYKLQPCTGQISEIILLRHGDVIRFPKFAASVTCEWTASEVQVSSSAAEATTVKTADTNRATEILDDEAEDESENLENTALAVAATQKKSQQPDATPVPQLSNQRSVIVQETPTAPRFTGPTEFVDVPQGDGENVELEGNTPSSRSVNAVEVDLETGAEAFSTAHTGESQDKESGFASEAREQTQDASASVLIDRSTHDKTPENNNGDPQIKIPRRASRKRNTIATDGYESDSNIDAVERSSKRAKQTRTSSNDAQDSCLSNIDVDTSKEMKGALIVKGKKRKGEVSEAAKATPSRSQRSSQRSNTMLPDTYEGPAPRVALSSSSITKTGQGVKFLKKQGGALVESISEPFNVLCVRDGDLHKTSKVLLSIARGTPIVTDKWLLDSAKEDHFLSVSDYMPSAPKQEKEWNIKLDQVLGQPQTPFKGYTIHFTKSLKTVYSPFTEIEQVCKAAGANKVTNSRIDKSPDTIVLAKDEGDPDVERFMQEGITCYHRDMITHSIFRGYVDLDSDEFRIEPASAVASAPKETKRRGRKSN